MKKYILLSLIIATLIGIYVFKQDKPKTTAINSPKLVPNTTTATPSNTQMGKSNKSPCTDILAILDTHLEICFDENTPSINAKVINLNNKVLIEHVDTYSLSPNKQMLAVVTYSEEFVKHSGAPAEYAIHLFNLDTGQKTILFAQIYEPTINQKAWDSDSTGFVFAAGPSAKPYDLSASDPFSIIYCTTICKVIATNAGPDESAPRSPYFENGKVMYTNKTGQSMAIQL